MREKLKSLYFPHDSNARNDEKIIELRMNLGWEGYGIYWAIIEKMRDVDGYSLRKNFKAIAFNLGCTEETVRSIVEDFGLFDFEENVFFSPSLRRRMKSVDEVSEKRREAIRKRWEKKTEEEKNIQNDTNVLQEEYKCDTNVLQSKEKEIKEKEIKEKEIKEKEIKENINYVDDVDVYNNIYADNVKKNEGVFSENFSHDPLSENQEEKEKGCAEKEKEGFPTPPLTPYTPPRKLPISECVKECLGSQRWIESVCMTHGLQIPELERLLKNFPNHLVSTGNDEDKTLKDFKSHFCNYLRISKNGRYNQGQVAGRGVPGAAKGKGTGPQIIRTVPANPNRGKPVNMVL